MQSLQQRVKVVLTVLLFMASALAARAQQQPAGSPSGHAVDIGVNYTYIHTNILSGCQCFSLNGGGAELQIGFARGWSGLIDFTGTTRSGITKANYNLNQYTYTFGLRYAPALQFHRAHVFGEALAGSAYATGSLAPSSAIGATSNVFDLQAGGGVLVKVRPRLQLMPVQADYVRTNFQNQAANHQNDVRISAGILIRVSR